MAEFGSGTSSPDVLDGVVVGVVDDVGVDEPEPVVGEVEPEVVCEDVVWDVVGDEVSDVVCDEVVWDVVSDVVWDEVVWDVVSEVVWDVLWDVLWDEVFGLVLYVDW